MLAGFFRADLVDSPDPDIADGGLAGPDEVEAVDKFEVVRAPREFAAEDGFAGV